MDIYTLNLDRIFCDQHLIRLFRTMSTRSVVIIEDVDAMSDIVLKRSEARCHSDTDSDADSETKSSKPTKNNQMTLSGLLNVLDGVAGEIVTRQAPPWSSLHSFRSCRRSRHDRCADHESQRQTGPRPPSTR